MICSARDRSCYNYLETCKICTKVYIERCSNNAHFTALPYE